MSRRAIDESNTYCDWLRHASRAGRVHDLYYSQRIAEYMLSSDSESASGRQDLCRIECHLSCDGDQHIVYKNFHLRERSKAPQTLGPPGSHEFESSTPS